MVEHAFDNIESYLEFFKEIDEIHKTKESTLKNIISEIEEKFADLLGGKPKKQDAFLIPEIPKFKREPKEERTSSRASKRNPSVLSSTTSTNSTTSLQSESSLLQNDSESFRRSSRLASKAKLKPNDSEIIRKSSRVASKTKLQSSYIEPQSIKLENGIQNNTYIVSPSQPPTKIRRTKDYEGEPKKSDERRSPLEESVCVADMKKPLGASTPTSPVATSVKKEETPEKRVLKSKSPKENRTPTNTDTRTAKGESVKKRIEEFEKRAKGHLLPSKLPVKTPEKSKVLLPSKNTTKTSTAKRDIFTEDESTITETRTLRTNSKVLQEKNTNVKPIKEKTSEAQKKKTALMKASIEENKRKREERERKVAAQRDAAEKEKLLAAMKLEKEREQKMKLHQKMKDEKLREETLRKKQIAAFKAAEMEERRKQEAIKLAKFKKPQTQPKEETPQYSIGTVLEGDSSEDEENPKKQVPSWASKKMREYPLHVQAWLNKKRTVYPWFYNKQLKYPKLEELFSIEVKTRPRTSSAFWNSRICFNESFPLV